MERDTGKFSNQAFTFMDQDTVCVAGAVVCDPPGNRDKFPFCRRDILDAHRNRDTVIPAAVGSYAESLVGEREDGATMGNTSRVPFTNTVHSNKGVPIRCFKDLHFQKPGKLACIEDPDLLLDC